MNHAAFVAAAFAISAIVLIVLSAWIVADLRRLRRQVAEMERRGMARRPGEGGRP